jgi:hypothetical protein
MGDAGVYAPTLEWSGIQQAALAGRGSQSADLEATHPRPTPCDRLVKSDPYATRPLKRDPRWWKPDAALADMHEPLMFAAMT